MFDHIFERINQYDPPDRVGTRGNQVDLYALFTDAAGNPISADNVPQVTIRDVNGATRLTYQSGVSVVDQPGLYKYSYLIPTNTPDGYWSDTWTALIGGVVTTATFNFLVLGDGIIDQSVKPVFTPSSTFQFVFTKYEAEGISILMSILKTRIKNNGLGRVSNGMGGYTMVPCNIFSDADLINFLIDALSEFNSIPHFTLFKFNDMEIFHLFADVIIEGAELLALAAQALVEKGKEFTITDNGISYTPPLVSDLLMNQYNTKRPLHAEKVKFIKASIKPRPLYVGSFRVTGVSPYYQKLRHLRERKII